MTRDLPLLISAAMIALGLLGVAGRIAGWW